jgi:hypothetical protein
VTFGWGGLPAEQKIRVRDYRTPVPMHAKRHRLSTRAQQVGLLALDLVERVPGLKVDSMRVSSAAAEFWTAEADRVDFAWAWDTLPFDFVHARPRNASTGAAVRHTRPCTAHPQTTVILRVLDNISLELRSYCPRCWRTYGHSVEYARTRVDDYKDIHLHAEALADACHAWQPTQQ